MNFVLDGIIIVIIAVCALLAAKKGFVRTLIEFVGFLAAIFLAFTLSSTVSGFVYDKTIRPAAETAIAAGIESSAEDAAMPEFILTLAEKAGINEDMISTAVGINAEEIAKNVTETALMPLAINVIKFIAIIVIFVLLLIVVKIVARFLNSLFKGVLLGSANKALGAVLGGAKGAIYSVVFCIVASLIVSITKSGFLFITEDAIQNSYICKFILGILPFTI